MIGIRFVFYWFPYKYQSDVVWLTRFIRILENSVLWVNQITSWKLIAVAWTMREPTYIRMVMGVFNVVVRRICEFNEDPDIVIFDMIHSIYFEGEEVTAVHVKPYHRNKPKFILGYSENIVGNLRFSFHDNLGAFSKFGSILSGVYETIRSGCILDEQFFDDVVDKLKGTGLGQLNQYGAPHVTRFVMEYYGVFWTGDRYLHMGSKASNPLYQKLKERGVGDCSELNNRIRHFDPNFGDHAGRLSKGQLCYVSCVASKLLAFPIIRLRKKSVSTNIKKHKKH
jgi:hypothetical protein